MGTPSPAVTLAGAMRVGGLFPASTKMVVKAEPDLPSTSVAVNVIPCAPAWRKPGVHERVARVPVGFTSNVAPAGRGLAVSDWMVPFSGFCTETWNEMRDPVLPVTD